MRVLAALLLVAVVLTVVGVLLVQGDVSPPGSTSEPESTAPVGGNGRSPANADPSAQPERSFADTLADPGRHAAGPRVSLRGRVRRRDGSPAVACGVELLGHADYQMAFPGPGSYQRREGSSFARSAETEADGVFRFSEVPAGSGYWLEVVGEDLGIATLMDLDVVEGRVTEVGDVHLLAGALVTGTVRARTGESLAGVRIEARDLVGAAVSDAEGRFELTLPAGFHELSVWRAGHAHDWPGAIALRPGERRLGFEIWMTRLPTLRGSVVDPTGTALDEAVVTASGNGGRTRTGTDGTFAVECPAEGSFFLSVEARGFCEDRFGPFETDASDLRVVLQPADRIVGTARSRDGNQAVRLTGLSWAPARPDRPLQDPRWRRTDVRGEQDGEFSCFVSGERHLVLRGEAPGYGPARTEVFAIERSGTTLAPTLWFESPLLVSVTAVDRQSGAPVAGARVRSAEPWLRPQGTENRGVITDESGGALLPVEPGRQVFELLHPDFGRGECVVEVERGAALPAVRVEVDRRGSAEGVVRWSNGEPAVGEMLLLHTFLDGGGERRTAVATDQDGRFHFVNLVPGWSSVSFGMGRKGKVVRGPGGSTGAELDDHVLVEVSPGAIAEVVLEIVEVPVLELQGLVTWNGLPRPGVELVLVPEGHKWRDRIDVVTDREGRFTTILPRPGPYDVTCWQLVGDAIADSLLEVPPFSPAQVRLAIETGDLRCLLVDVEAGTAVDRGEVALRQDGETLVTAVADPDGTVTIRDVASGSYEVNVVAPGYLCDRAVPVEVIPSRACAVRMELRRGGWIRVDLTPRPAALRKIHSILFQVDSLDGQELTSQRRILPATLGGDWFELDESVREGTVRIQVSDVNPRIRFEGRAGIEVDDEGRRFARVLLEEVE